MREVTVATVQMKPALGQMEDNLVKMSDFVSKVAGQQKVDLIVFPELAIELRQKAAAIKQVEAAIEQSQANLRASEAALVAKRSQADENTSGAAPSS